MDDGMALDEINCHSQRSLSEDPDSGTASDDNVSKRSFVRQVSKVAVTRKWAATTMKRNQRWAKHVAQKETYVQGSAKRWALGCVNIPPPRGQTEPGGGIHAT